MVLTVEDLHRLQAARLRWLERVNGEAAKQAESVTNLAETPAPAAEGSHTKGTEERGAGVKA
jgi:hypothetical protein